MDKKNTPWGQEVNTRCEYNYPIAVLVCEGGRRARCLNCGACGPLCEDVESARQALFGKDTNQTT
jgi:polyferredoxin